MALSLSKNIIFIAIFGLYDALGEKFETQLQVVELGENELSSDEEVLFNEWKSINGLDEEDCDDSPFIYEINIELDDSIIGDIIGDKYEKLMDDDSGNYVIYETNICDDNIYDVLEEYGISRDRVDIYTHEMRYFDATEVNISINY